MCYNRFNDREGVMVMYDNFICYRGGSSGGILFADELYKFLSRNEATIGSTYYSPRNEDKDGNFILDPQRYIGNVNNFIILLTRDFFNDFFVGDEVNPDSITRLEIDEVLRNKDAKIIPVVFNDFSWNDLTNGRRNRDILTEIWGEDATIRISGSFPIRYIFELKESVIHLIFEKLTRKRKVKKIVFFDFDGTLTKPQVEANTWEKLWSLLGYDVRECETYHQQYSTNKISHEEWCEITEKRFKEAGCNEKHLKQAAQDVQLIDDAKEVITRLKNDGIKLYILSGSIKEYIEFVLKKESIENCFIEIKANRFLFNNQGLLEGIIGTPFDFEGKARFVNRIIQSENVQPKDILFVGNSFNDASVYKTGVETLCINPVNTDFYDNTIWHNFIRRLNSLKEILPYIYECTSSISK